MEVIPLPHKLTPREGTFYFSADTAIVLNDKQNEHDLATAKLLRTELRKRTAVGLPIQKVLQSKYSAVPYKNSICFVYCDDICGKEAYRLSVKPDVVTISACSSRGFLYGAATLIQICRTSGEGIECLEIEDEPSFKNRGYMLDVSRGRIPKMDSLKRLIDRLALYKINQFQLYMENCLRLTGFEEVWSHTDPFTPEEILELDAYCSMREIELVPCIATFGHLYDLLRSKSFRKYSEMDTEIAEPFSWFNRMRYHIVNAADPESLTLVKNILDQCLPLFRSNKVNICCDETFDLGKGKSAETVQKNGYAATYLSYVNCLAEYLQSKGKEVMIWGDVAKNHTEHLGGLNPAVTCLNWYYDYGAKAEDVQMFSDRGLKQYVCPSVTGHNRLVNDFDLSFTNIREMAMLGARFHAVGLLNTEWGDFGHINMPSLSIPGMIYGAAQGWNVEDDRDFDRIDRIISLVEYGDSSQKLVPMLRELSQQDAIIFEQFVYFRDYKVSDKVYTESGVCLYEKAKEAILQIPESTLKSNALHCKKLIRSLLNMPGSKEQAEFCLSARGVALLQELALVLKEKEYGQKVHPMDTPRALACKLQYWLADYCKSWRACSRESELYRIREFVEQMCSILYEYK